MEASQPWNHDGIREIRSTVGLVSVLEVLSSVEIIKGEALGPADQAFGGSLVLLSRGILLDQLV